MFVYVHLQLDVQRGKECPKDASCLPAKKFDENVSLFFFFSLHFYPVTEAIVGASWQASMTVSLHICRSWDTACHSIVFIPVQPRILSNQVVFGLPRPCLPLACGEAGRGRPKVALYLKINIWNGLPQFVDVNRIDHHWYII